MKPAGGTVLALDPGTRRVGLAVSDPGGRVAIGLQTFVSSPGHGLIDHLGSILQAYGVTRIVVGHPRTLQGTRGHAARRAEALARRLRREFDLEVELWDERLTTVQAERVLRGSGAGKEARDRVAAVLILQAYLDRQWGDSA